MNRPCLWSGAVFYSTGGNGSLEMNHGSMSSKEFIQALLEENISGLTKVPKADLHNHSIYGTRIEHIESWIGHPVPHPPASMKSLDEMIGYTRKSLYPFIDSREGFEFTLRSALRDAIEDGVTILEMSMDVRFISFFGSSPDPFFIFIHELIESTKPDINFRPEIGLSKDRLAREQMQLASSCIQSGLFRSIDLYGNETAQSPSRFRESFVEARKHGLKLKAHVGEFAGPDLITETLDILELDEIQHGIAAARSVALMNRLRRNDIRLNICPSSNVALGVVRDLAHHPIRILVDNGIRATLNTDDLTIFGQSASQEYLSLYRSGVMTATELDFIRLEGLSS
jgi:adenosine deaminase